MGDAQRGGVAEYEDIARAFGKTQAYTEMWAAISKSLKKGEFPSIDSHDFWKQSRDKTR